MGEIAVIEKLKDELMKITDENGNVKEGYENRAKYILGELNEALGTEYTMNGNIIEQYDDLRENIDKLILKKKAEATLNAYQAEYEQAIKNQAEATETLIKLREKYDEKIAESQTKSGKEARDAAISAMQIADQIKNQTNLISEYGYTIQNYEALTSASVSENAEEIQKAVDNMGITYDRAKTKAQENLAEQIKSQENYLNVLETCLQDASAKNDKFQEQILNNQKNIEKEKLNNLVDSLIEQTSTVDKLSNDQKEAWKALAENNMLEYNQALNKLPEDVRNAINKATGVINFDGSLKIAAGEKSQIITKTFGNNLKLHNKAKEATITTAQMLNGDTSVQEAASELGQRAEKGFKDNTNGAEWGSDLGSNISGRNVICKVKDSISFTDCCWMDQ